MLITGFEEKILKTLPNDLWQNVEQNCRSSYFPFFKNDQMIISNDD